MRRQKLHFDNLDEVLKSSKAAQHKGTQQFETPREQAEALCTALNPVRPTVFDPQCGHGELLRAAAVTGRYDTHELLGLDIDPTAAIPEFAANFNCTREILVGDFVRVLPMLLRAQARFDMIVANPPYSLDWLIEPATVAVDSTLATFEAMHHLLTKRGEGLMICSGATCDRLLVPHPLYRKTWLRLNLPNFFTGTVQKMQIAVLYFTANHSGDGPLTIDCLDAMPATILRHLEFPTKNRDKLITGDIVKRTADCYGASLMRFDAVGNEWRRMTDAHFAALNGWNIKLDGKGNILTYLTPFQKLTGDVPREMALALSEIDGKHPTSLVVQRVSRKALVLAVQGNIWRVHPAVERAVETAMRDYNGARAPLRPLNPVQRLGHLDEEDTIRCERTLGRGGGASESGPGGWASGFTPGCSYPLESETFEGRKVEQRKHWRRTNDKEAVLVTGQELLLRIKDDFGQWHAFTQYELGAEQEKARPEKHFHLLSELVEHFHIPDVPDVAALHPAEFKEYQARLLALEWS